MSANYINQWHNPHNPIYGPAIYSTDVKPKEYRGFLIYERIEGHCWDVVRNGRCLTQRAGPNGAREYINEQLAKGSDDANLR